MALLCRTVSKVKVGQKTSVILREFGNVQNDLKANLAAKIPQEREYINLFRKTYGKHKIGDVTIDMIYGGMRGLKGLLCETSVLSPEGGIRFRGYTIPECQKLLPTAPDSTELLPESLFWLLITGDVPTESQVRAVSEEWAERATIPPYVNSFLKSLPKDTHPMTQLAAVITVLSRESQFRKAYADGVPKWDHWKYVYEDSMDLIANLPIIGAKIYRNSFKDSLEIALIDNSKDWAYNFVHMLGFNDSEFVDLMRLILSIHCDHEGGNVSAHTVHLVGSTLADPYLALASGMNGLAGPLHGLANQEVLQFLQKLHQKLGNNPSEDQLKQFIRQTIESGQVIPGYGHAVLRKTDPRYTCQREFALRHLPHEPLVELVSRLFEIVPPILMEKGKVKNPWPNVDAHSGVLLHHYGIRELSYYTVIVAMGRALGVLASLVWDRALGMPIERPKSLSTKDLMKHVSQNKQE